MLKEHAERVIATLEAEINNGGFDQFLFNSAVNETAEIINALTAIGATKTADIVCSAVQNAPGGLPPADRDARQDMLLETKSPKGDAFEAEDARFSAYEEDLTVLLQAYRPARRVSPTPQSRPGIMCRLDPFRCRSSDGFSNSVAHYF